MLNSYRKQCILSESRFDFLRDLVKSVPEVATSDDDNWVSSDNQTNDNSSSTSHSTRSGYFQSTILLMKAL